MHQFDDLFQRQQHDRELGCVIQDQRGSLAHRRRKAARGHVGVICRIMRAGYALLVHTRQCHPSTWVGIWHQTHMDGEDYVALM